MQKQLKFLSLSRWTHLLNLALVVLLCWSLAQWTWVFLAPAPGRVAAKQTMPGLPDMLQTVRSAHLFGASGGAAASPAATATALDLKLNGVLAAHGKLPAVAIIKVEGQGELPFKSGDKVMPGVSLERVAPDHVMLRRGGVLERLDLEREAVAPRGGVTVSPRLNVRPEGAGKFGIPSGDLRKLLADPSTLAASGSVSAVAGKGVRIDDAGGLIARLGLKRGDVITRINNRTVEQAADLFQGYRDQIAVGTTIRVQGIRNGQPFEYNYTLH